MVRTRFAPSPSGSLHVGNARVAVLNWLLARHHGGAFLLRIEDTDQERTVPGAEETLAEDLRWLGLDWDEGPGIGESEPERGGHGPYRQMQRLSVYQEHAHKLLDEGLAFRCFCTPEELEARRRDALARNAPPHYDGTCRRLDDAAARRLLEAGRIPAIRFHVPMDGEIRVRDAVRGEIRFSAAEIGDFIILRSDGVPTYNFAVVVDDALMEITHVVRGSGHLSNTPRQVLLFQAFGYPLPVFAHVPTVLGPDRQKLSKRHGAQALADYRREGYHPDALVNYLSLLSWSSESGEEFLDRTRLVREMSLERIGVADVVFDGGKLRWLSGKHIEAMPLAELVAAVSPFIDRERFPLETEALPVAVAAVRSHLSTFSDINEHLDPFVGVLDAAGVAARSQVAEDPGAVGILKAAREAFSEVDAWSEEVLAAAIRATGAATGTRGRALYEPVRLALTGRPHGPPLAAIACVLGKDSVLRLLEEALDPPN
jgi:nondiscriminating glutamyl-tRNA synthetase